MKIIILLNISIIHNNKYLNPIDDGIIICPISYNIITNKHYYSYELIASMVLQQGVNQILNVKTDLLIHEN